MGRRNMDPEPDKAPLRASTTRHRKRWSQAAGSSIVPDGSGYPPAMSSARPPAASYVLIDAENVDWAVSNVVGRKPEPQDRVQFDRLVAFCERHFPTPDRQ